MNAIFGQRLHQARVIKGCSLRDLAGMMEGKVSHNALARYERGEMMPGSENLVALSAALGQPVDFFFRPFKVQLREIRFRKKARLTKGREESAKGKAAEFFERYREVEELTASHQPYEPPFKNKKRLEKPEDAEQAANDLRGQWQLGTDPIPNVMALMEEKGIKIFETELDKQLDGFCTEDNDEEPLVVINQIHNIPRKRMTCVHELAHVVLNLPNDEELEEEIAWHFAGAFLLPKETFTAAMGGNRHKFVIRELIELKRRFGVSIMGIMKRARQLDLIDDKTARGFWIYASKMKWRANGEPGDNQKEDQPCFCSETPMRFRHLVWRAVSENLISISKGAALLKEDVTTFRRQLRDII